MKANNDQSLNLVSFSASNLERRCTDLRFGNSEGAKYIVMYEADYFLFYFFIYSMLCLFVLYSALIWISAICDA